MKITPKIAQAAINKLLRIEHMSHNEMLKEALMDNATFSVCVNPDCYKINSHLELGSSEIACSACGTPTVYGIDVLTDIAS